jgi:hypothetical protein
MADKFNLDGFAVSDADVCTADGGFVGNLTGVVGGQVTLYVANGAIDVNDTASFLNPTSTAMTLADGVQGQRLFIYSAGTTDSITIANLTGGDTITLDDGEVVDLIFSGTDWFVVYTTGVVS